MDRWCRSLYKGGSGGDVVPTQSSSSSLLYQLVRPCHRDFHTFFSRIPAATAAVCSRPCTGSAAHSLSCSVCE